jgi:hypothetical protein
MGNAHSTFRCIFIHISYQSPIVIGFDIDSRNLCVCYLTMEPLNVGVIRLIFPFLDVRFEYVIT